MDVTGIIIAGGESSRMGKDKGLLLINGKPMVLYVIEALSPIVLNTIIISNNKQYEQFGLPTYSDIITNKGPAGGIYTGLKYTKTEVNLCLSCDIPFITSDFLKWLLLQSKNHLVTTPSYKSKTHQLIGVYKKSTVNFFKKSIINNNLKLKAINRELNGKIIPVNEDFFSSKIFKNINTQNELNTIINESER